MKWKLDCEIRGFSDEVDQKPSKYYHNSYLQQKALYEGFKYSLTMSQVSIIVAVPVNAL